MPQHNCAVNMNTVKVIQKVSTNCLLVSKEVSMLLAVLFIYETHERFKKDVNI